MRRSVMFLVLSATMLSTGVLLSSCEKRVTPRKVERIISVDSWKFTSFMFMGGDSTVAFAGQSIGFGEDGSLTFLNAGGIKGQWTVGTSKKPTILYVSSILTEPHAYFNDNWEVKTCSKEEITLSADHGSYINTVVLTKVEF